MQAREVFIKSDGNGAPLKITFEGQTFGELKAATQGQVSWDNSIVRLKGSRVDLIDDGAFIPSEGPVYILVAPQKQKGGMSVSSLSRNELMRHVSGIIAQDGDDARVYFGNYPQMKTVELVALVDGYEIEDESAQTVEETEEMQAVRLAFVNAQAALNALGQLVIKGEETYGGVTLAELNADYASIVG